MMAAIRPVVAELSSYCGTPRAAPGWVHSMLTTDWSWSGRPGGIFQLFQEMEDKDAHLFATLQTRKNALLACPWKVVAADDSPQAQQAAELVRENLSALPSLSTALFHLLDAISKGFALAEIIWEVEGGGVRVKDIRSRAQSEFAFGRDGQLYLLLEKGGAASPLAMSAAQRQLLPRPGEMMLDGRDAVAMPSRKFLHFTFQGNSCSPYGAALCVKAYWYYWLKKSTLQHWALFNEKFGSPTAVARYPASISDEELRALEETVASLPRDSGVLLPEGVGLEFLEARRSSGANTYRELADWCNDEISKVVLGQTLTTAEGRRSGSLALGQVHEAVRRDYLASDAAALGQVLSSQLARWITDFNLGEHVPAPRVVFDVDPPERFETELRVDRELVKMGVPISAAYFYERYRRPMPREGERTLRFDDANLYQYHLLHGVLTINEVRATLGLPKVPWGDQPTGQNARSGDGAGTGMPPSGSAENDADEADEERDEGLADRQDH
jgi:phage gp29-like protein